MTRSTNYVATQYRRKEGHLAPAINNKGCNCAAMSHTILPVSCLLAFCVSGPLSSRPVRPSPGRPGQGGARARCLLPWGTAAGAATDVRPRPLEGPGPALTAEACDPTAPGLGNSRSFFPSRKNVFITGEKRHHVMI